jgi:hypothetical protein
LTPSFARLCASTTAKIKNRLKLTPSLARCCGPSLTKKITEQAQVGTLSFAGLRAASDIEKKQARTDTLFCIAAQPSSATAKMTEQAQVDTLFCQAELQARP